MNNELHGLVIQTNEEYHSGPGISKSHLDVVARSPFHYWAKYLNPNRPEPETPTQAMILGTATHTAILEPDLFPSQYITLPENAPKRPTSAQLKAKNPSAETILAIDWWEDFEKANAGKIILTPDDYATCMAMRDAVHTHPVAAQLLTDGESEQSFYAIDNDTGELIKCRPDWLRNNGVMVDVKTTEDASPDGFGRSVANYRYFVQAPWYLDILKRLYGEAPQWFIFIAVEKKYPFGVGVYFVENDQLDIGRARYVKDLAAIHECKTRGTWPGYSEQVEPLRLPKWLNT